MLDPLPLPRVADVDAAVGAISHLKDDDLGRAGILLGGSPADEAGRSSWPSLTAGATYAVDVVECRADLRPAVSRLLHKVVVVDDLATLTLDLLVSNPDDGPGLQCHGVNLLLLFGEPEEPPPPGRGH